MALFKRSSSHLLSIIWIILMVITWVAFAPTQAGGLASYIVVIGNSMEPRFHIGDLVIAHKQAEYHIGDAVVYRNEELSNFVFHRIIEDDMGKFIMKGDNNAWTDTYQPTRDEVVGKLWLYVPKGGSFLQKLRNPFAMAVAAGLLGGFLVTSLFGGKDKGNKRMKQKSFRDQFASLKQKMQNWFSPSNQPIQGNRLETWFYALVALVLISLITGIISFSKPASRIVKDNIQFEHVGFFSYSAPASQRVYDSSTIQSGDPIFPKLTCSVDMNFQYTFISQANASIAGTYQLTATVYETVGGWKRVVPLQEVTTFNGNVFGATAKLNLCQIESLIQSMEEETDFHAGNYLLTISPNVNVVGDVAGSSLKNTFDPSLTFNYDRIHFYTVQGTEEEDIFNPTETGATGGEQKTVNTLLFFGTEMAVPALRWFSVIVTLGSLAGVAFVGMKMQELSKQDQSRFIRLKYNSIMVDVHQTMLVNKADIVDVASIDDLAKLAEKFSTMILHAEGSALHSYYVRDNGATYRFVLPFETEAAVPDATREAQS